MRNFAPDPESTVDVAALRVFQHVSWTPQHRVGYRGDPLAALSTLALALGSMLLFMSILGAVVIGLYVLVT